MSFKYRDHRGSLADSMETVREFQTGKELADCVHGLWGMTGEEKIEVNRFAFDKRINWDTYIVTADGSPVGMTDGPVEDFGETT